MFYCISVDRHGDLGVTHRLPVPGSCVGRRLDLVVILTYLREVAALRNLSEGKVDRHKTLGAKAATKVSFLPSQSFSPDGTSKLNFSF